ncbi:MAG: SpoIIE family protein phosphatase [Bacteroidia bacterium]
MRKLIAVLFLLAAFPVFSQNDSLALWLKAYVNTSDQAEKLACLNKITYNIRFTDCSGCIKYCDTAEALAAKLNDQRTLALIYINKSVSYRELAKNDLALDYSLRAVNLSEKNRDSAVIGAAYLNLGAFQHTNNVGLAEKYYLKALEIFKALKDVKNEYKTLGNLSDIYHITKCYDLAYNCLQQSIALRKKDGNMQAIGVGYYLLAFNLSDENVPQRAIPVLDTAIHYLQKAGDNFYIFQSLILKAEVLNKLKKYESSNALLLPLISDSIVRDNIDILLGSYHTLSLNFEALQNSPMALKYSRLEKQYSDSLYKINNINNLNEMQEKFETVKKEQKIELLNKEKIISESEIGKQKIIRNTFIVGSLLFLAFIFICLRIIYLLRQSKTQVSNQKELLEHKNKEIIDSFNYAHRIQEALLPHKELLKKNLSDHFVLFRPKDIVSGDFYWASRLKNGNFAIVTADSTGHGVPGAFMSLLNISFLNESINGKNLTDPGEILNNTRSLLIDSLSRDGQNDGRKDGMDCTLCVFDFKNNMLHYAAANNSFCIVRTNELIVLPADKMPVGRSPKESEPFVTKKMPLQKGDMVYTFTDGYADQFGGPKDKKLMVANLKQFLLRNSALPLSGQNTLLQQNFDTWKGSNEQVDDVLVIGIKV